MSQTEPAAPGELLFGRYLVFEQVHEGGMSRVFRARDTQSDRLVALKRPARDDPSALARFFDEARFLEELSHPAVVRLLAHGGQRFDDAHLIMEWLAGDTLEQRLQAGPLSLLQAVTVARRAADALSAVHRANVVHRDLKPTNLILCDGLPARTTLIDFGIARRAAARGLSVHASFAGGTWAYMSPEQAMGSAELGARADVYALGCVLFEAITGQPAFPADRARAVLAKVWQPPPKLSDFCVGVAEPLHVLLAKALATDPSQRQGDGAILSSELHALGKLPDEVAVRRG